MKATLNDGTVHEISRPHLRGGAREPLSREELVAKAKKNMAFGGWPEVRAERLLEFCETLEDSKDLSALREFRT